MISLTTLPANQLKRAIERAVAYEPTIIKVNDALYRVNSERDKTQWYDVKLVGQWASCSCPAHTLPCTGPKPTAPMFCKHLAAVFLVLHVQGSLVAFAADPEPEPPTAQNSLVFDYKITTIQNQEAWYRRYSDGSELINFWVKGGNPAGTNYTVEEATKFIKPLYIEEARAAYDSFLWLQSMNQQIDRADGSPAPGFSAEEYINYIEEWFNR